MEQLLLIDSLVNSYARFAFINGKLNGNIMSSFRQYYRYSGQAVYLWNCEEAFVRLGAEHISIPRTANINDALHFILTCPHFGIFILPDIQQKDLDGSTPKYLKELMSDSPGRQKKIIFTGEQLEFPEWLEPAMVCLSAEMFIGESTGHAHGDSGLTSGFPLLY